MRLPVKSGTSNNPDFLGPGLDERPVLAVSPITKNVLSGAGRIKWMSRGESKGPRGQRVVDLSCIDTTEYLADTYSMQVVDYTSVCEIDAGHRSDHRQHIRPTDPVVRTRVSDIVDE